MPSHSYPAVCCAGMAYLQSANLAIAAAILGSISSKAPSSFSKQQHTHAISPISLVRSIRQSACCDAWHHIRQQADCSSLSKLVHSKQQQHFHVVSQSIVCSRIAANSEFNTVLLRWRDMLHQAETLLSNF